MSIATYPGQLHPAIPEWVERGSLFHIRICCAPGARLLTDPRVAQTLLDSAVSQHRRGSWHGRLFLLMPDHLHAILAVPSGPSMNAVVGNWKAYHERFTGVVWQAGFLELRLPHAEDVAQKAAYIRGNPVASKLCEQAEEWPWVVEPYQVAAQE